MERLKEILRESWNMETCYPPERKNWSKENPAWGQCVVTALIVQDYFGGDIVYCKHLKHFWNRLPDGTMLDLTRHQYTEDIQKKICLDGKKSRKSLLRVKNIQKRYELLKEKIDNY